MRARRSRNRNGALVTRPKGTRRNGHLGGVTPRQHVARCLGGVVSERNRPGSDGQGGFGLRWTAQAKERSPGVRSWNIVLAVRSSRSRLQGGRLQMAKGKTRRSIVQTFATILTATAAGASGLVALPAPAAAHSSGRARAARRSTGAPTRIVLRNFGFSKFKVFNWSDATNASVASPFRTDRPRLTCRATGGRTPHQRLRKTPRRHTGSRREASRAARHPRHLSGLVRASNTAVIARRGAYRGHAGARRTVRAPRHCQVIARRKSAAAKTRAVSQAAAANPSGLVAAYGFDEGSGSTVTDASGNGNNGTITNATWSTARASSARRCSSTAATRWSRFRMPRRCT